jgi:hypothetical protein
MIRQTFRHAARQIGGLLFPGNQLDYRFDPPTLLT